MFLVMRSRRNDRLLGPVRRQCQQRGALSSRVGPFVVLLASANIMAPMAQALNGRTGAEQKGSVLVFPLVEVRWDDKGTLIQDTFLELTNDYLEDVYVQLYFVNGDPPEDQVVHSGGAVLERAHPGWNNLGAQVLLTGNEPVYWSTLTGMPLGVAPWALLDPGQPPGRPDPLVEGERTIRGFLVAWAVDANGREIRWNHLTGTAVTVNYAERSAWEYKPYAFQARGGAHGTQPVSCEVLSLESGQCVDARVVPGRLDTDGIEYDACPGALMFEFIAVGAGVPDRLNPPTVLPVETTLTLMPCGFDLRQETEGPITTKANFDIWNENEVRFSGTERCVTCWDSTPLDAYMYLGVANHFFVHNLQTDRGKARVHGLASRRCDTADRLSEAVGLLGVARKAIDFPDKTALAGTTLSIQGSRSGQVFYDVAPPTSERSRRSGKGP